MSVDSERIFFLFIL